jgi:hypothetical protein
MAMEPIIIELNLWDFHRHLQLQKEEGKRSVFDPVRQKWLVAEPEELVRQSLVQYLLKEKGYVKGRIGIEKKVIFNKMERRCDILVYDSDFSPFLLIECKAPKVEITDEVFWQIARYNMPLQVPFLAVTNGIVTYCCKMNYQERSWYFMKELPNDH